MIPTTPYTTIMCKHTITKMQLFHINIVFIFISCHFLLHEIFQAFPLLLPLFSRVLKNVILPYFLCLPLYIFVVLASCTLSSISWRDKTCLSLYSSTTCSMDFYVNISLNVSFLNLVLIVWLLLYKSLLQLLLFF